MQIEYEGPELNGSECFKLTRRILPRWDKFPLPPSPLSSDKSKPAHITNSILIPVLRFRKGKKRTLLYRYVKMFRDLWRKVKQKCQPWLERRLFWLIKNSISLLISCGFSRFIEVKYQSWKPRRQNKKEWKKGWLFISLKVFLLFQKGKPHTCFEYLKEKISNFPNIWIEHFVPSLKRKRVLK